MQLENSFNVAAPPVRVFAWLLDVHNVVGCVPGAELTEVVDPTTFKGKVKVKVGPITVAYSGTARIVDRDDAARSATLEGDGRETTGPGSARAKGHMTVEPDGDWSVVRVVTEYNVAGRVAQFGRGVMEDVSRRIAAEVTACIKAKIEKAEPGSDPGEAGGGAGAALNLAASAAPAVPATPQPINAAALLFSVLWARLTGSRYAGERLPMEPLDPTEARIGVMLVVTSAIVLALGAAVVVIGLSAIFNTT